MSDSSNALQSYEANAREAADRDEALDPDEGPSLVAGPVAKLADGDFGRGAGSGRRGLVGGQKSLCHRG